MEQPKMTRGGKRPGAGRKRLFEKTFLMQIRIDQADYDAIPKPKTEWVREVIKKALDKP